MKEIDPDIIHLHNIHGYYINIEILFKYLKEANKPVVWTLHDCWSFTGHCAHFDYVGCDKWKTGCYSCPEKKAYPSSLIFDNSKNNYINKKEIFTGVKNLTEEKIGKKANKVYMDMQPGDVLRTYADVSDLENDTGFKPRTSIEEGLGKFVDWYKEYYGV